MHSCDARSRCPGFDFVWLDYCGTLGLGPLPASGLLVFTSLHLQGHPLVDEGAAANVLHTGWA